MRNLEISSTLRMLIKETFKVEACFFLCFRFLEKTFMVITIAILCSCQAANETSIGITPDLSSATMPLGKNQILYT